MGEDEDEDEDKDEDEGEDEDKDEDEDETLVRTPHQVLDSNDGGLREFSEDL